MVPHALCPLCGSSLVDKGTIDVKAEDGRWSSKCDRMECAGGHVVFAGSKRAVISSEQRAALPDEYKREVGITFGG